MQIRFFTSIFIFCTSYFIASAQSFQILDINQIFRPSVRFEWDQSLPQKITGTENDGWLTTTRFNTSALIPVAGDLGLQISLDIDKPKDLLNLRKNIKPKGYQILLNTGVQYIRPQFSDFDEQANIMQVNLGALAMHYKGLGAMFYAINAGFSEDISFPEKTQIRYSALIGYMKLVSLRKQIFYGAFITPINNIPVPIPFFGMNKKINKKWRFTMILPAQAGFIYKHNRKLKQYFDVGLNAIAGGIPNLDGRLLQPVDKILIGRTNFTKMQLRFRTCVRYKPDRNLILMAHAGINSGSILSFSQGDYNRTEYLTPTLFFNVSVNYLFTKSLVNNLLRELVEW